MTDQMENTLQALDSLCANEFAFEIEGEVIPGVFIEPNPK